MRRWGLKQFIKIIKIGLGRGGGLQNQKKLRCNIWTSPNPNIQLSPLHNSWICALRNWEALKNCILHNQNVASLFISVWCIAVLFNLVLILIVLKCVLNNRFIFTFWTSGSAVYVFRNPENVFLYQISDIPYHGAILHLLYMMVQYYNF